MNDEQRAQLHRILANFDSALAIRVRDRTTAQPIAIARPKSRLPQASGSLCFCITDKGVDALEIGQEDTLLIVCQRPGKHLLLTVDARVVRDADEIARFNLSAAREIVHNGARLLLLETRPTDLEYWDDTGMLRMTYPIEAARSLWRGARVAAPNRPEHEHISL